MFNTISGSLPHLKKIVLFMLGVTLCLASYTGIRSIIATSGMRVLALSNSSIARSFVQTGDNSVRATQSSRTLSFAERVSYQRAIEEVYWRHRIWPKERADSKPSLDAVISKSQLENKVNDYLRKSHLLADYWHRPLTAQQLQAEIDRMVQHTKQAEMLRELFAALGNDPFVIAE